MSTRKRSSRERGAVAVEMAIVLPLLILIIAGIIDLGRLFFVQTMVTNAAREGARMKSLGYTDLDSDTRVNNASPGRCDPAGAFGGPLDITYVACPSTLLPTGRGIGDCARRPTFDWLILGNIASFFGATPTAPQPTATASMRCLG